MLRLFSFFFFSNEFDMNEKKTTTMTLSKTEVKNKNACRFFAKATVLH